MPDRTVIDFTPNKHGDSLISFLTDTRYVVLNGRCNPEFDNFTSISTKGVAVVDYMSVKQESLSQIKQFKVLSMNNVLDEVHALHPDIDLVKPSDHSILLVTLSILGVDEVSGNEKRDDGENEDPGPDSNISNPRQTRFRVKGVKSAFFETPGNARQLIELIDQLIDARHTQEKFDVWYRDFVSVFHSEMCIFYKEISNAPRSKKNARFTKKAWWNEKLTDMAKRTHDAEKTFLYLVKKGLNAKAAKQAFLSNQWLFDKEIKRTKRCWQRAQVLDLESVNDTDPNAFWDFVKNLRRGKRKNIPNEVYEEDGVTVTNDLQEVLNRWERDFGSLLAPPP